MYPKMSVRSPKSAIGAERERLILEHLPQVKLIASRIHDKLPESVVLDDLISAGVLGLIDAVDHFNPGAFGEEPDRRGACQILE